MDRIPPIDRVLKWTGGDNFDTSQVEDGNDRFLKYYLAFEVDKKIHHIVFMRCELGGRTDTKDSETKDLIERKIREKLRSILK